MERNVAREVLRLKELLLQSMPLLIEGKNFSAINYGDESQGYPPAGIDSKISSASGSAIINRLTGKWRFTLPHIPFREVSHIPSDKLGRASVDLTFEEVREIILKNSKSHVE